MARARRPSARRWRASRRRERRQRVRCLYLDLDGTLLGRGASLLHDGEGARLDRRRARRAGVPARRRRGRADVGPPPRAGAEDARLLGQRSFIFEAGACLVLDGEEHWLTGELLPGELTIAEQIERSGAPALLLEHYAGRLEYHEPWHVDREVSHLFRGLVDAAEVDRLLAEHGHGGPAAGRQRRRQPPLAGARGAAAVRGYHLVPGRRLEGGGGRRPPARARLRAGGDVRRRRLARGPRLRRARWAPSGWSPTRSSAIPRCARRSPRRDNVRVAEAGTARASTRPCRHADGRLAEGRLGARAVAGSRAPPRREGAQRPLRRAQTRRQKPRLGRLRQRAGGGTVARTSATQSSSGSSPAIRRAERARHGRADARPLERPREQRHRLERLDGLADALRDLRRGHARRRAARRRGGCGSRRERRRDEVARAGEPDHRLRARAERLGVAPDLGEDVAGGRAGGVQPLRLGGARGERRGVLGGAGELDADRVVGELADDAGAREDLRRAAARAPRRWTAAHERGARVDHLLRVRGPAEARDACGAERRAAGHRRRQAHRAGRGPWRATRPRRGARAGGGQRRDHLPERRARAPPGTRSRRARRRRSAARCAAARAARRRAGSARSRARASSSAACSACARLQRRAQAGASEQHRERGAERAGADHGRV